MRNSFGVSISAAALLASAALGASAARAADPADGVQTDAPAAHDYNTDNGVHAVPSGHVATQSLGAIGRTAPAPAPAASPARLPKRDAAPAHLVRTTTREQAPSSLQWLSLRLSDAPPGVVLPVADEAPAAPPAPAAVSAPADPAPPAPPAQVEAAAAPAAAVVAEAPPPAAPATTEAPTLASAPAAVAAPAQAAAAPAAQDTLEPPAGGSEEDAVYRRSAADAEANPAAAPTPEPVVARVREAPQDDQGMGQHVAFPRGAAEAAGAFDGYMHAVAAIDAGFRSGQGVAEALQKAAAYDPRQLEEGMIAYGAMAAMQSARFVYGVMDIAADARSRRELADRLMANPEEAERLPGAREAGGLAWSAIQREARPVVTSGYAIKQASYDVQHQSWSIAKVADQTDRLAQAKALSHTPVPAREGDVARVIRQIADLDARPGDAEDGITPVAAHSLALAALAILDEAGGPDPDRLEPVTTEQISAQCLKMAKLNLFQCLSVAGPEYEDIYCLGQHAVLDTGQCVAGGTTPRGEATMSYARSRE